MLGQSPPGANVFIRQRVASGLRRCAQEGAALRPPEQLGLLLRGWGRPILDEHLTEK